MLAPKYTLSTLVIALVVLIGFAVQNPEQMTLSAAHSQSNDTAQASLPPIHEVASPSPLAEEGPAETTGERAEAALTDEPAPTPKAYAPLKAQTSATPAVTAGAVTGALPDPPIDPPIDPPLDAHPEASPEQFQTPPETEKAPSASSSAPPVKKPVKEYIGEGDDPVANVKKVNLASTEIMKIKAQFELLAANGESKPDWKHRADLLVAKGMDYLGTPYVFGAKAGQTESFDCSSFLQYLFAAQEVKLPRDSRQQSQRGTEVSIDELREGDLVFFTTPKRRNKQGTDRIGHVAVYIGNGLMLHTFRPGIGVTVSELDGAWKDRFIKAKRILS